MRDTVLLLSDLHLPNTPSPLRETFLRFLAGPAREAGAVYILGDLFEYWIGDDVGMREYVQECAALRDLADSGVTVHLMHGNRDFMVGHRFAQAAGLQLLADPVVETLNGARTLLSHGDVFCTSDLAYQRWRRFSRMRPAQIVFGLLPERQRRKVAFAARGSAAGKPVEILDVSPEAVRAAFIRYGVDRIIHGHTHRPGVDHFDIEGRTVERIVLPDWRPGVTDFLAGEGGSWCRRRVEQEAEASP